ncbi:MAG: penicillin-binding protein 2 [Spirochaetes bacterium]|nr:penicillin-binding protein 2 [Spirochaetota bacterium]
MKNPLRYLLVRTASRRRPVEELRPHHSALYRGQLGLLGALVAVAFAILLARLFYIQVIRGGYFEAQAINNKQQTIILPAERGEITVDDGAKRIAHNAQSFSLYVVPYNFPKGPERAVQIQRIASEFGVDTNELVQALKSGRWNPYRSRVIALDVPLATIVRLAEHLEEFPGLGYQHTPKRVYEDGMVFGHVVGYINLITPKEFEKRQHQGYHRNSMVGAKGIEAQYDLELRGQDGYQIQMVDARSRVKAETRPEDGEPVPGNDLVLTIDSRVQKIISDMMQGYPGGCIVTRPATGEVLGLYSYPSFDPNIFIGRLDPAVYAAYTNNKDLPFFNRVIQGEYPPSSVFKAIVSSACLADDEINFFNDHEYCAGGVSIGPQFFKCEGWHNSQNMLAAFANSCNVYYMRMGTRIGSEKIIKWASDYYNLGKPTGIDLPYEKKGRVPTHRWKSEIMGTYWWDGDTANLSIGQGYMLVTIAQLNTVTCALANEGVAYQPHLLSRIKSAIDGRTVYSPKRTPIIELPLDREKIRLITKAMRAVVQWGTASKAASGSRLALAGKTGTAENVQGIPHAWFTCYGPYETEDPKNRLACTVFVEHGGHGGSMCAPFATAIMEAIFLKTDVRYNYKRIMQNWEGRRNQYEEWLQKRREDQIQEVAPAPPP